ncbi:MAG: hypothetical protein SPK64_03470 [Candidatus Enterosoma sp.]|nr:hypothetical protein [Bacilli bacterium]MDD7607918.1 hypothetical protein [bacterium]MDY5650085.1 hypothetical protein [Candidatus Enterosoma sp.]MDY5865751.1 hypothetical protein [Candidatus Enterosoma sp.]
MKKSVFQICLISTLVLGMVSALIILSLNLKTYDNRDYYPEKNSFSESYIDDKSLATYRLLPIKNHSFPDVDNTYISETYFDEEISFVDYEIDETILQIGDKIENGSTIGKKNGADVISTCNGIVVMIETNKITIKKLTDVFIDFYFNIYYEKYVVGDQFDFYLKGDYITDGEIINIDYINIQNNSAKATIKINNDNLKIQTKISLEFLKKGYSLKDSICTSGAYLYSSVDKYQHMDKVYSAVLFKDSHIKDVTMRIGICFGDYYEISQVLYNGLVTDINGGQIYVK